MSLFGNLFKPKAQSDEEANRSVEILERLKQRRGQETGKWLAIMQEASKAPPVLGPPPRLEDVDVREVLDEAPYSPPIQSQYFTLSPQQMVVAPKAAGVAPVEAPAPQHNETADWVNRLFAEFSRQAADYNASATGTHVVLTVHSPEFRYEPVNYEQGYQAQQTISIFKGHIGSLHWAMLVQGYEDKIDIYVISADEVLNFKLNDVRESQTAPFMTIASTIENEHRVWNVGGTPIDAQTVPLLAKELLGDLVRIATGTMSEAELFADHSTALKLGETVAHGYASQQPPPPTADANTYTLRDQVATLTTWSACSALLNALHQDLSWLTSTAGAIDPEKDQETAKYLHDLSTAMRTLSGQVDALLSENHPAQGSKYNAS